MIQTENFFSITVFIAGIMSFFAPCIFPILPVYMSILADDVGERAIAVGKLKIYLRPVIRTATFVLGLSTVFVILGFGAGALGSVLKSKYISVFMGLIVIVLGLHQMGIINIKTMQKQKSVEVKRHNGYVGAFILGLGFSFGWTPCIGPVLSSVMAISATGGGMYGLWLMFLYSMGLAIPFLILSVLSSVIMKYFGKIKKHMVMIKKVGGGLIVLMGIMLILGQFNILAKL